MANAKRSVETIKTAAKKDTRAKRNEKERAAKAKNDGKRYEKYGKIPKDSENNALSETDHIDFCGVELNARWRAFLIYYLTPGQSCFHNALQSALQAGYTEGSAKKFPYLVILRNPDVQKIIKANEALAQQSLQEAAKKAIELKKQRAFFDPADYYDVDAKKGLKLKELKKMTPEQRLCIDGVDTRGKSYLLSDRHKELNDIIKLSEKTTPQTDTNEEETREIIIERITIREKLRALRPADLEKEFVEMPNV